MRFNVVVVEVRRIVILVEAATEEEAKQLWRRGVRLRSDTVESEIVDVEKVPK